METVLRDLSVNEVALISPAFPCPACNKTAARLIDGLTWCTSPECDPRQNTYRALDRYYTARALATGGKLPHINGD